MAMGTNEQTFKASILCQDETNGTAYTFDFGYRENSGTAPHIDTGTAAGNFQTLVQASFLAIMPERVHIRRYRFATVYGPFKGEIGFVEADEEGGITPSGHLLPQEVAISFKRSTGYSSRRDRGRIFFGPVDPGNFQQAEPNGDLVENADSRLVTVSNLLKNTLTTQGSTLDPVILAADGTHTGRIVIKTSINPVFVHRKTRRLRVGV